MTELPSGPWKEVAVDFAGPFPSGDYLMIAIDEYSRLPEVEILTSVYARAMIPKRDAIFARQGISDVVKSGNESPFNSLGFKKLAEYLAFKHRRSTPYWPKVKIGNKNFGNFFDSIELPLIPLRTYPLVKPLIKEN